jgi:hypothetical protein
MRSASLAALMLTVALCGVTGLSQARAASGDQELANRVLPRVADYPAGWAADATSKPTDSGCFTAAANAHAPTARAQASPDFLDQASQERSGANVWIFPSAGEARAALAAMTRAAPLACYRRTISSVLAKAGLTVTSLVTGPLVLGTLGDGAKGTRLTVSVRKGSDRAQLIIDLLFVRRRRALVAVGFNAQSSRPLLADERRPLARSVARVPA